MPHGLKGRERAEGNRPRRDELPAFLREVLPGLDLAAVDWRPVHHCRRSAAPAAVEPRNPRRRGWSVVFLGSKRHSRAYVEPVTYFYEVVQEDADTGEVQGGITYDVRVPPPV